ncbi:MAG: sporulation protein YqfD, partial [Oscillospiraceae bacterium]|nr:sporulation protein YqfD [Oscillospiraceae bacterium]
FAASGSDVPAFRDAVRAANYPCRAQCISGGVFRAAVRWRHWGGLRRIAENMEITLTVERRRGLRYRIFPYRRRLGLLAGLAAGAFLLYRNNARICDIRIIGNSRVSDTEILTALNGLGITYGTPFREIEFTWAEQRMRLAIHDIEWITLRHKGGILTVDLTEEREKPEMHSRRNPSNYVAAVQAQITDMHVLGGTAVKAVGDAVKAGDLLISGVTEDSRGITRYQHAEGVVTGIYEEEFCRQQSYHAEIPVRGTPETAEYLELLGRKIPLTPRFSPPEGDVVYEEFREPITLFGMQIPVMRLRCVYTPRLTAETDYSPEETKAMLTEAANRYLNNFHAADRLVSSESSFTESETGVSIRTRYVFEGEIGRIAEFFVDESRDPA